VFGDGDGSPEVSRLLEGLDPAQLAAVTTPAQPLCILAGAGSGKTRVLTRRIAHRALTGTLDPRRALALTFSRRAAGELRQRLGSLGLRDTPTAGTFHAIAYAQLRSYWEAAGTREPALLDRKGRMVARLLPAGGKLRVGDVATEIEWAKARLIAPDDYEAAAVAERRVVPADPATIADLYRRYEDEKRHRGVVDFDDLLARAADALERDASFAAAQRWRFQHLFVDEYQDVNALQHRLLRAWLGDRTDLCVVGDPNQAIYRWNGADASFLSGFPEEFPDGEVRRLDHNHRSSPEVVTLASAALTVDRADGPQRGAPPPALPTVTAARGAIPTIASYADDHAEAVGIARALREHHRPGRPWSDQAVLVRTNAQTAVIEQVLRKARIPYRVRGAASFIDRPGVREALRSARESRTSLAGFLADLDAAVAAARTDEEIDQRDAADRGTEAAPDPALAERLDSLDALVRLGHDMLVAEPDAPASSFPGWLIATVSGGEAEQRTRDAVDVASFHASKGLEWRVVHLAGLEEGYVPSSHARSEAAVAEERRLLYVALTRAEHTLSLSWAQRRTFGSRAVGRSPSRWLSSLRRTCDELEARELGPGPERRSTLVGAARDALERSTPPAGAAEAAAPQVADALRAWRRRAARAAGVPDAVVLPDRVLAALVRSRPGDAAALADVPGLGRLKADRYADELLPLLRGELAHPELEARG
jgi:DNA helicase-2/ATP-dependent DNA helicase PcrA